MLQRSASFLKLAVLTQVMVATIVPDITTKIDDTRKPRSTPLSLDKATWG